MKSFHHYPAPLYNRPSKLELVAFGVVVTLAAIVLGLLMLCAGCSSGVLPGETPSEARLVKVRDAQLSHASAAVDAAKFANEANPDGLPKAATAGELNVAEANLPSAKSEDAREALARVNAALTGQLAAAQKQWSEAVAQGNALQGKVAMLEKQVIAERATAAANEKKANDRLCIIAALIVGGVFCIGAGLSLAAGMYFGITKLEYGAGGLGLCGALAFFAATQVGTEHFNFLATLAILGGLAGAIYVVWQSFAGGAVLKAKASGFDQALIALRNFAEEVANDAETDAKNIWHWLSVEWDQAHKALVADWQKLETLFASKPKPAAAPSTPTPA